MDISGRHVVVTGAASGIGRALATRFVEEGARAFVVADLDLGRQAQLREQLPSLANRRPSAYRWPEEVPA
jgi:NAD(P)-dependent dehydrogenase (short-subunit alcohol dehydrogenase family)